MIKVGFHPHAGHPKRLVVAEARCDGCNQRMSLAMHADAAVAIEAVAYVATQLCAKCDDAVNTTLAAEGNTNG